MTGVLEQKHTGMGEEPTKSIGVRIKGMAETEDIRVGVCNRPPDQEDQVDEALFMSEWLFFCSHKYANTIVLTI